MSDPAMIRRIKETIERRGERPAREQIEEMVNDHVIDREGNVLIRRPETSPWSTENGSEASRVDSPTGDLPEEADSVKAPRAGWAEAFEVMVKHGDDALIDSVSPIATDWDESEWEW